MRSRILINIADRIRTITAYHGDLACFPIDLVVEISHTSAYVAELLVVDVQPIHKVLLLVTSLEAVLRHPRLLRDVTPSDRWPVRDYSAAQSRHDVTVLALPLRRVLSHHSSEVQLVDRIRRTHVRVIHPTLHRIHGEEPAQSLHIHSRSGLVHQSETSDLACASKRQSPESQKRWSSGTR